MTNTKKCFPTLRINQFQYFSAETASPATSAQSSLFFQRDIDRTPQPEQPQRRPKNSGSLHPFPAFQPELFVHPGARHPPAVGQSLQNDVPIHEQPLAPRIPQPGRLRLELRAGDAGLLVPKGDEDRPDVEHRRGGVCGLLAAVFHLLPPAAFSELGQRSGVLVFDVVRVDQLSD